MMDNKRSWVIAIACSWIAFCNTGIYRSSSVLYVELIQSMALTRETASWPFSLFGAVSSFTGILPGLLSNHFSVRQFVITGALLSTLGVLGCVLANDAIWITVSFGIVAGFGSGLIMTLLPVVINENFKNNRATANGIFLSGSTISLLVLPSVTEWLVNLYALKGTFLLLSGLVLNVLVGAMFFRKPPKSLKTLVSSTRRKITQPEVPNPEPSEVKLLKIPEPYSEFKMEDKEMTYPFVVANSDKEKHDSTLRNALDTQSNEKALSLTKNTDEKPQLPQRYDQSQPEVNFVKYYKSPEDNCMQLQETQLQLPIAKKSSCFPRKYVIKTVNNCVRTLLNPMFILITFCSVTTRTIIVTVSLILVDYVMDKGETEIEGVILVSVVAIPELVGRLGSGWISDHKFLRRKYVFLISEAFSGICLFLLTIVSSSFLIFTLSALFALANGGAFILVNVFYLEYLGLDRLPVALGLKNVFTGLASLTRPWFIGIFRDQICSYDKLFQVLGVISILAGAVWFLEPFLQAKSKPTSEIQEHSETDKS